MSRDTVGRIVKLVGKHAKAIHDQLVKDQDVPEVQMDEMWAFVKKKDKHLAEEERASGEVVSIWDHVAVDPATKLMVSLVRGPSRDQETCDKLVEDFANRTLTLAQDMSVNSGGRKYRHAISAERSIRCEQWQLVLQGLGNQKPVEGIAVMVREARHPEGMSQCDGEDLGLRGLQQPGYGGLR